MVKFHGYRKNRQWVVTWRSTTGSVLSQSFNSEQEASVFENSLLLIAEKERSLLKKRKREQSSRHKITVKELVEQYLASQGNTVTQKQNGYHAAHIVKAFGQRQAARLAPDDARAFIAAQQARGVARITATGRCRSSSFSRRIPRLPGTVCDRRGKSSGFAGIIPAWLWLTEP